MGSKMGSILLLFCVLISWCTLTRSGSVRTRREVNSFDSCLDTGVAQYTCCLLFGQNCNPSFDDEEGDDKKKQKTEKKIKTEDGSTLITGGADKDGGTVIIIVNNK